MRAILIDPFTRTVKEVEHDGSDYRNIYTAISHETMPVDCFTVAVRYENGDGLFLDDEGLLKPCDAFFMLDECRDSLGFSQPLAGKALLLGSDDEGESVDAKSPLSVFDGITWLSPSTDPDLARWLENFR